MTTYKNSILNIFANGNQSLSNAQYKAFNQISNDIDYAWNNWDEKITATYYEGERPQKAPLNFVENWLDNEDFEADGYDVDLLKELFNDNDKTYDIQFNDSENSNNKGFSLSLEDCKTWIENNRNSDSYFSEYKGGTVSIVDNASGETVHEETI